MMDKKVKNPNRDLPHQQQGEMAALDSAEKVSRAGSLSSRVSELHGAGYTTQAIADSLDVSVSMVRATIDILGLEQKPRKRVSYGEALRRMGLSESYIQHVAADRAAERNSDKPVFDRGPWGEALFAEGESEKTPNKPLNFNNTGYDDR